MPSRKIARIKTRRDKNPSRSHIVRIGEVATEERKLQQDGIRETMVPDPVNAKIYISVQRARGECWLDRYHSRGHLNEAEFKAGLKFRSAWLATIFGLGSLATASIDRIDNATPMTLEDRLNKQSWSEQVLKQAMPRMSAAQKLVVIAVCGTDEAAGDKDRIQTLRRGLEALARLWEKTLDADVKNLLD